MSFIAGWPEYVLTTFPPRRPNRSPFARQIGIRKNHFFWGHPEGMQRTSGRSCCHLTYIYIYWYAYMHIRIYIWCVHISYIYIYTHMYKTWCMYIYIIYILCCKYEDIYIYIYTLYIYSWDWGKNGRTTQRPVHCHRNPSDPSCARTVRSYPAPAAVSGPQKVGISPKMGIPPKNMKLKTATEGFHHYSPIIVLLLMQWASWRHVDMRSTVCSSIGMVY